MLAPLISITGKSTGASQDQADQYRNKTFAYLLSILLPHLPGLFPSSIAQKAAFGPGAYLVNNGVERLNQDMERREAEVWGLAAA
jgi:DNA topoisomerase 2-associated protein PAT1